MIDKAISQLGLALARGDVALWVGPDWTSPTSEPERAVLGRPDWISVWSESKSSELAKIIREVGGTRFLQEVPEDIESELGATFSFADLCPYFYLNGREGDLDEVPPSERKLRENRIKRERSRKIEVVERLRDSTLLVAGFSPAKAAADALNELIGTQLRSIWVTGCSDADRAEILRASPELEDRLVLVPESLTSILVEAHRRRTEDQPSGPAVRVGSSVVPVAQLLRTEPPIDQDFILITASDVREPDETEDGEVLLLDLLRGSEAPWRAFAHGLAWDRDAAAVTSFREILGRHTRGVTCVEVPAESGAGLTTLLRRLAFESAQSGHPTFVHRQHAGAPSHDTYHRLRAFLTDLDRESGQQVPAAVLVVELTPLDGSASGVLLELPRLLERDGRSALVVYGAQFHRGQARSRLRLGEATLNQLPTISSQLSPSEIDSLVRWAQRSPLSLGPGDTTRIRRWAEQGQSVPLLICLYFLIRDHDIDASVSFGAHLVKRVRRVAAASLVDSELSDPALLADRARLAKALQRMLNTTRKVHSPPSASEQGSALIALAAAALLDLAVPRSVLSRVLQCDDGRASEIVTALEHCDLATSGGSQLVADVRLAPHAFYTGEETVSLRHSEYGFLILDWLNSAAGQKDSADVAGSPVAQAFLSAAASGALLGEILPLRLLRPFLTSLRPTAREVKFADEAASRYLRLQRRGKSQREEWQWTHQKEVLEAIGWIDEQVVRQSASLLHTRGITRYKTTLPLPIAEARSRYEQAVEDFRRSLELSRQTERGEHPGNILSSLGLLYLGWAERERLEGFPLEFAKRDSLAEDTLRQALAERTDNPYAAYGLAKYLVSRVKRAVTESQLEGDAVTTLEKLGEALLLLDRDPGDHFEEEWNEVRLSAIDLLDQHSCRPLLERLRAEGNDLGFALKALAVLEGRVPRTPVLEEGALSKVREASKVLHAAEAKVRTRSTLGDLLRYALFSADADRLSRPAYDLRLEKLRRLENSRALDDPTWLFDYAMLLYQNGHFRQGDDAFRRLRHGQRFFEVPLERSAYLVARPDSLDPRKVKFKVTSSPFGSADAARSKGWGRIEDPVLHAPVPFSVRKFRARGKPTQTGAVVVCYLHLTPSGPFAEPDPR